MMLRFHLNYFTFPTVLKNNSKDHDKTGATIGCLVGAHTATMKLVVRTNNDHVK